ASVAATQPTPTSTPFPYTTLFRSNYSFDYHKGTLTVGKATLKVTADDQHITYGDSDPAFTFTYDGFVNAQDATVLGTEPTCSVAGAHANAGAYDITCAGGVDNNYSFDYHKGTLTVGKATLKVTADDQHITYGDSDPAFTFTYDGFVNAQDATVLGTEPTCSVAGAHANAGAYDITCAGGVDNNYSFDYHKG